MIKIFYGFSVVLLTNLLSVSSHATTTNPKSNHGIALYDDPKYPANFTHFEYVNPNAPKGGSVRLASTSAGGFDSLNPFIVKGIPASGLSYIYDSLMVASDDEPFAQYGLIAESAELAPDRSYIIFRINPKARFHDDYPITAEDVVYSFNLLIEKGHPRFKVYYNDVDKVEAIDKLTVKFSFKNTTNRELPLIVGQFEILPKHYWETHDFTKTSLDPPLGSGPYKIVDVKASRSITYERVKDYWAKDLPVNKGRYNYDRITFEYYLDNTIALEAFKAGEYDLRLENTSRNWATSYTGPQFDKKYIIKEEIPHENPTGMQAFIYNIRREPFDDRRVREALSYAFDFEWTNQKLQYGAYTRTKSFFSNSELASSGLPSEAERKLLLPFKDQLPEEVFTEVYQPPITDGSGNARDNLKKALNILTAAGWELKNNKLIHKKTGKPLTFEILTYNPDFQRIIQPFKKNLEKIGVTLNIRRIDTQQYVERTNNFDFDMIVGGFGQSNSPGNEQRDYWSSAAAKTIGSNNIVGITNPVVDQLVEKLISAQDRETLITAAHALDRVLLWNYYVIPQYHIRTYRVAYWNKFAKPEIPPKFHNFGFDNWWIDEAKNATINKYRQQK